MVNILGINISKTSKKELLANICKRLKANRQTLIATPNPEIILSVAHDEELFYILNHSDYAIPDGIGLKFAGWLRGQNLKRITGADLLIDIINIANENKLKILIMNREDGLSTNEEIICSVSKDAIIEVKANQQGLLSRDNKKFIETFRPDVLIVALGSPFQEKIAYHALKDFSSIKLAIGVGGAFDFLTGKIKRAPKFLRFLGLEWLWRLKMQPARYKRIWNAAVLFPLRFLRWEFILPFFYRQNVACLLYRAVTPLHAMARQEDYEILIVERTDKPGHWQIPQGGTDGMPIEEAGAKELREELHTNDFKLTSSYKKIYKYLFSAYTTRYGSSPLRHCGYKGQEQGLCLFEYFGDGHEINVNYWDHLQYRWVNYKNFIQSVHPERREGHSIFLEKFLELKGLK